MPPTTHSSPARDALLAGLVVALTSLPSGLSLAALVFAGPLAPHLGVGIAVTMFSGLALAVIGSLRSGQRGMILIVQDKNAVILAGAAATVAAEVAAHNPGADPLPTVLVLLAIASLTTGAVLWTLGRLHLGRLVRFVPYPVIAGFVAGTGFLLITGGLQVMVRGPFTLTGQLAPELLARWLPGLLFGVGLTWWTLRRAGRWSIPGALLGVVALFYAALRALGGTPEAAMADGWLLGPLPTGAMWPPPLPSLAAIDGAALLHGLPSLGPLVIVAVLGLLLNISSAEAVTDLEFDLDRELRATGVANLVVGCGAGLPGYVSLSAATLVHRMGVVGRGPPLVAAATFAAFLAFGAAPLAWVPRLALGGLLVFLGVGMLYHALHSSWSQLPRRELALVLAILGVIAAIGFIAGVGVGLLVSVALFALDSSRVDIVKQSTTGAQLRSNTARASRDQAVLDAHGGRIRVVQLQGYIFFGSAHRLLTDMTRELDGGAALAFLVVDFRHVVGIDCSAATTLARLQRRLETHAVVLVCTGLDLVIERLLRLAGCTLQGGAPGDLDLDRGLEWCEEQLLSATGTAAEVASLTDEFAALAGDRELLPRLLRHAELVELPAGAPLFRVGDECDGLYLIEAGRLTAWHDHGGAGRRRLRTMGPGSLIGEAGLYRRSLRSAAVVSDTPARLQRLSNAALEQMRRGSPELLAELHRVVATLLADRLVRTTAALQGKFHVS